MQADYLVAVQGKEDSLPKLTDFITNMPQLKADAAMNNGVEDIKVEYDLPTEAEQNTLKQKMLKKPALYTVPLKVTVKYKDAADYKTYRLVGRLKVIYQLMYDKSLPKNEQVLSLVLLLKLLLLVLQQSVTLFSIKRSMLRSTL